LCPSDPAGANVEAGADEDEVAEAFGLAVDEVRWAMAFEL
jgi:hypothetical protein